MVEMVIPMEDLDDPMPIRFTFKVTNIDDITIYVKSEITGAPANWNIGADEQHGALGVGVDNYFLNDNNTRDKPADGASDTINLRITYYSDAGYTVPLTFEDITYDITYVDFTDVRYAVVDDDTFEVGVEGWAWTDEVDLGSATRSTVQSRTGVASLLLKTNPSGVGYAAKDFTISGGGVAEAYIRIWLWINVVTEQELIIEIITDSGDVSNIRTLPIAMDSAPQGGAEMFQQWIVIGAELPVNAVYTVKVRLRGELGAGIVDQYVYLDDIRVVEV